MNRLLIPFCLAISIIVLLSAQCTFTDSWIISGVHLELVPPLLLYAAFTVGLSTSVVLGLLAALMYDSFSGCNFGASMIPYVLGVSVFCAIRPVFFRNRISTQFLSGIVFSFVVLILQWALSGKFMIGWNFILESIIRLSLLCGILAVFYFFILDACFRFMGLNPGRFEESLP